MSNDSKLKQIVHEIALKENFKNPEISLKEVDSNGFTSLITLCTITDKEDGKILHLFIKKCKPTMPTILYENETNFFLKLMPKFNQLCKNKNLEPLKVPKCYYADNEYLVFENIQPKGFDILKPLEKPLDEKHIKIIIRELSKMHAISIVFQKENPVEFEKGAKKFDLTLMLYDQLKACGYIDGLIEKVSKAYEDQSSKHLKAFLNFTKRENLLGFLEKELNDHKHNVISHGDAWTNNYLFDKNDEIYLVDFQKAGKSSPVNEVALLIGGAACCEENFDKIDVYLKYYHENLLEFIRKLNGPVDFYTWGDLMHDWKVKTLKTLHLIPAFNKMLICDQEELNERDFIPLPLKFDFVSKHEHKFHHRIRIVLKYFYENTDLQNYYKDN